MISKHLSLFRVAILPSPSIRIQQDLLGYCRDRWWPAGSPISWASAFLCNAHCCKLEKRRQVCTVSRSGTIRFLASFHATGIVVMSALHIRDCLVESMQ